MELEAGVLWQAGLLVAFVCILGIGLMAGGAFWLVF